MAVDTLLQGALIIDGTGQAGYHGDIAIKGGVITAVGETNESSSKVVDSTGLVAAPGFWDIHSHYDAQLLWDPMASSSGWHGVTTIAMGNCGFTIAPARPADQDYLIRSLSRVEGIERTAMESTLPWSFESYPEYLDLIDKRLGVNVLSLIGHSAVRRYVLGQEASHREATEGEIEQMRVIVREALRAGAIGFSTSRAQTHWDSDHNPVPSRLASDDERRVLVSQMKGMTNGFFQGTGDNELSYDMAELTGRPYEGALITQAINSPPGAWKQQMGHLQGQIAAGKRLFGMCPVDRSHMEMWMESTNLFDRWTEAQSVMMKPRDVKEALMRDPAVRERIKEEMKEDPVPFLPFHWGLVNLIHSSTGRWSRFEGKTVTEIGEEVGKHPLDAAFDISLDEELKTQFRLRDSRYPEEEVMVEILKHPHILIGMSDAGAHMATIVDTGWPTYLLGYWARERQALSLEEAVHILTARPADEIGITDRGRLAPGQAADIVLFNPETVGNTERAYVQDLPGGASRLVQRATGIEAVYANGVLERQGDRDTGDLAGKVLRSTWSD